MPVKRRRRRDLDSPWKEALDYFLEAFLAFFFPKIHAAIDWQRGYQALDKEFQQIVREAGIGKHLADKLYKVWRRDGRETWLLIHVEIQGNVERPFPKRMFVYNIRAFQRYNRTVVSLAVLCDERPDWRPDRFEYGEWGCKVGIRYPIVKLLDYHSKTEELERSQNPFAAVVLAHLKANETRQDPDSRQRWKIRLVKGLYERNWKPEDVRKLFCLIDWLMELPREFQEQFREDLHTFEQEKQMPYVSSIERLAKEEGRVEGRVEGRIEGRIQELLVLVSQELKKRFGAQATELIPHFRAISDLRRLRSVYQKALRAESLEEVRELLS